MADKHDRQTLDEVTNAAFIEHKEQHITLGIAGGLSMGVLATAVIGPEITDVVLSTAQQVTSNEWLNVYKHCLEIARNLESGMDKYVLSFGVSLPIVAGISTAIGFGAGVYYKIRDMLGYKPKKPTGDTWLGRYWKIIRHALDYTHQYDINHGKEQAIYFATKDVCAEVISQGLNRNIIKISDALEQVADEKTRYREFKDERALLRVKGDIIHFITDYAAYPDTDTFNERFGVSSKEAIFTALVPPYFTMNATFSHTQSIVKTVIVGAASAIVGFVGSVYVYSAVCSQLLSNELKQRKEESRILYENFLAKVNSL